MCQQCIENPSPAFMRLLPEEVGNLERYLRSERQLLENFKAQGPRGEEGVEKIRPKIKQIERELKQLRRLLRPKEDLRFLDRQIGNINVLGAETAPRVIRGEIALLEQMLESSQSPGDARGFANRLIILKSRLSDIAADC